MKVHFVALFLNALCGASIYFKVVLAHARRLRSLRDWRSPIALDTCKETKQQTNERTNEPLDRKKNGFVSS